MVKFLIATNPFMFTLFYSSSITSTYYHLPILCLDQGLKNYHRSKNHRFCYVSGFFTGKIYGGHDHVILFRGDLMNYEEL
jgi:hypothetical protein